MNSNNNIPILGNSEISSGFLTAKGICNPMNSLAKLPWDKLLSREELDPNSRKLIRKEIIRRYPELETKLNEYQWDLIHVASEYGSVGIVKVLLISTIKGRMSPSIHSDKDFNGPLDYASMKGIMEVIHILLDAFAPSASTTTNAFVKKALYLSLEGNWHQAFRVLAIEFMEMENWDSKKVAIIKTTNKLLMETPRPSDDVPTEVFEALNKKLISTIRWQHWDDYFMLEKFLASDLLLYRALSSRSCPLETRLYLCMLTRRTDYLLDEIYTMRYEFKWETGDQVNKYPMHSVAILGYIHIVKLILIYESGPSTVCLLKDMDGNTPLHCAALNGRVSVINILLPTCWECAGLVSDKKNETALHCALRNNRAEAFKTLLEWYIIKEEFSSKYVRDWECGDTALDLLVDGYIKIVKEMLGQSDSEIYLQTELREYFVVIKYKNKESSGTSFKYQDYIGEVTNKTTNRTILSVTMDSRSTITLKVLIWSVTVRRILDVRDADGNTVFDLLNKTEKVVENEPGTRIPTWSNKLCDAYGLSVNVYNDAKEQLDEGTKNGCEGIVADGNEEQFSMAAKEHYVMVNEKVDHRNNNEEPHDQEMPTGISIPDRVNGYTIRNQDGISFWKGQSFASLEECRNTIKDAAILSNTEVKFSKSTGERIVAECSDTTSCKWKIRAKAKRNSKIYVVTEVPKNHTCPRLKGTTNKLATPKWVSSHITDNVRQDPNISTQRIIDIMKQSKYRIDINCKTADRAKKRALDIIQESPTGLKKRKQNSIASSSLSLSAHQSQSNLRFLEGIPEPMHEYIHSTEDVQKDGHCGFRVIAIQSGYEEMDAWKQVRRELLIEIVQNEELYVKLMDIDTVAKMRKAFSYYKDHATDSQYWLSLLDAGYVIANAYKAVVVSLSLTSGNLTFLPLLEPPQEGRPHRIITFGFVNRDHFISVNLKPDAPIPQIDSRWDTHVSKIAEVWKTPYLNRIDIFKEIMGFKLCQTGEPKNLINLEDNLQSPTRDPATCREDAASSAKEHHPEHSSVTAHSELQLLIGGTGVLQSFSDPLGTCAHEAGSLLIGGELDRDSDATSPGVHFYCSPVSEKLVGEGLNGRKRTRVLIDTLDEFHTCHSGITQSPDRAMGKATWFTFTGCASTAPLYGCANFVTVYNFPVSPEQTDFYKWIVETHGHIPSTEVLSERNTLITSTRMLIDIASAMQKLGEACPSEEDWATWQEAFKLPRILKFNIAWLESLLAGIDERRNSRRLLLSGEIAQLEEEVAEDERKLTKHRATQLRLVTEAAAVVLEIEAIKSDADMKRLSLTKKKNELAALP